MGFFVIYIASIALAIYEYETSGWHDENWLFEVTLKTTGSFLVSLFLLHFVTKAIGWVVRGFAGIPQGQDSKPE